jgi:hypothetical protein
MIGHVRGSRYGFASSLEVPAPCSRPINLSGFAPGLRQSNPSNSKDIYTNLPPGLLSTG